MFCLWEQVGEPKFLFEGKTIQRMELLVLSTLRWRMQAYTPCTFIDYFMRKMNLDEFPSMRLVSRSIQLILSIIKGYTLSSLFGYRSNLCYSDSQMMLFGTSNNTLLLEDLTHARDRVTCCTNS